jgi:4-hydroxyphenylpyruvate dioxygenase
MANHFAISLGMSVTGTTSQATGNDQCVSYALESSGDGGESFRLLLTAPYSRARASGGDNSNNNNESNADGGDDDYDAPLSMPNFSVEDAHAFFQKHGLAARAVGVEVKDAKVAFEESVARGAVPVMEPSFLPTCPAQLRASSNNKSNSGCYIAEVELYGDVVLRYVSFLSKSNTPDNEETEDRDSDSDTSSSSTTTQPFLPHLAPVETSSLRESYGIYRIDHAVGNVHDLQEAYSRILGFTGFHEFAEFTSEDVGTVDSGLNSVVLASDTEEVLLPINEPTNGR